ncbi:unnamed protein product, partial [Staurois parvus]
MQGRTDNSWGPSGNRGSWGPCVLAQTQKSLLKRYQGHLMGPRTDPGPSGQCPSFQMVSPSLVLSCCHVIGWLASCVTKQL